MMILKNLLKNHPRNRLRNLPMSPRLNNCHPMNLMSRSFSMRIPKSLMSMIRNLSQSLRQNCALKEPSSSMIQTRKMKMNVKYRRGQNNTPKLLISAALMSLRNRCRSCFGMKVCAPGLLRCNS